jgi:hypothetical protein
MGVANVSRGHVAHPACGRYGLSVTGAAPFRSTSAIGIFGQKQMWNRGIVFANDCVVQSTFQDLGNPAKSVDIRGNPQYGIFQSSPASKNYFAGKTGLGTTRTPKVALDVGGDVLVSGRLLKQTQHGESKATTAHAVMTRFGTDRSEAVHRGRLVLDPQGAAVVAVPRGWSEATERETATISVTPIGAAMPALHVVDRFEDGDGYIIVGGVAGGRVHFHVVAAFVDEH